MEVIEKKKHPAKECSTNYMLGSKHFPFPSTENTTFLFFLLRPPPSRYPVLSHFQLCMKEKARIINPRRACAARVTVLGL